MSPALLLTATLFLVVSCLGVTLFVMFRVLQSVLQELRETRVQSHVLASESVTSIAKSISDAIVHASFPSTSPQMQDVARDDLIRGAAEDAVAGEFDAVDDRDPFDDAYPGERGEVALLNGDEPFGVPGLRVDRSER